MRGFSKQFAKASRRWWTLLLCLIPLLTYAQSRPDIVWRLGAVVSPTAISANGELFVSDGFRVWHLPTHQLIRVIPVSLVGGSYRRVEGLKIALSPDGTRLAAVATIMNNYYDSPRAVFVLIEPQTGAVIRRLEFEEHTVGGVTAFSVDGLQVAFAFNREYTDTGNRLVIARASDGAVEQVLVAPFPVQALRYLADGRLLAACRQSTDSGYYFWPWIWEVFSNTQRRINRREDFLYDERWELSPDGGYLVVVGERRDVARFILYDVNEARLIRFEELPFHEAYAVFSHDSQALILAMWRYEYQSRQNRMLLQVRRLPPGEVERELWDEGMVKGLLSHPFRPEVFVSNRILNWQTGEWVGSVGHFGGFLIQTHPVQFSPDGRLLVIASRNDVSVWRVADRALHYRLSFTEPVHLCQVSPDGRLLAVGVQPYENPEGTVFLYNLEDGSLRWRLFPVGNMIPVGYMSQSALRFSPDGTLLAIAPYRDEAYLYRTADGALQGVIADYGYPLVFSPDGRYLVTRRYVWQLPERLRVFTFNWTEWVEDEPNRTWSAAFSKDGAWLAAGSVYDEYWEDEDTELAGDFQLVRVGSWEQVVYRRDTSAIAQLAFLPDGQHLIVGKDDSGSWVEGFHRDGSLHLWLLPGPVERVNRADGRPRFALSSTSRYLVASLVRAVAGPDDYFWSTAFLLLWHLQRGRVLRELEYRDEITEEDGISSVVISPDERLIALAGSIVRVARNPLFTPYGDVNGDGCVDDLDLLAVLNGFGSTESDPDVNGDGQVDDADLLIVLFNFDTGC